jgi:ribose 5-phosphate isomerase B
MVMWSLPAWRIAINAEGSKMAEIPDAEIRQIVQRTLHQAMGLSKQSTQSSLTPLQTHIVHSSETHPPGQKIVAVGADHGGYELKEILKADISALGFEIIDVGTTSKEAVDYPDFAHSVARLIGTGKAWRGIVIDGAGIGSCIVANKVPGVRAGLAYDYSSAVNSREHNDTNVLTLGAGLIGTNLAKQIVKTWLSTLFGGERHARRVDKIVAIEKQYLK